MAGEQERLQNGSAETWVDRFLLVPGSTHGSRAASGGARKEVLPRPRGSVEALVEVG